MTDHKPALSDRPNTPGDTTPVIERLIGHADWCPRKGEPANIGKHCSTCGERIRVNTDWESVEDRLRRQLAGAVAALGDILDIETNGVQVGGVGAADVMRQIAQDALDALGGQ